MFRELPGISRTIVFTDSIVHEGSSDPVTDKDRSRFGMPSQQCRRSRHRSRYPSPGSDPSASVCFCPDSACEDPPRYPYARFTFDLSGGSKELCLALFAFAPWLGGEVYAAFDEKTARTVPLPDRTISSLLANPNHQQILAILLTRR